VGDEKEAALAVADRIIFALEPGRAVGMVLCFPARFMRGVLEWILDHGVRDLSLPSLLCSDAGATILDPQQDD
jgi:hypothetical protein